MFQRQALVIGNSAYSAVRRKPCVNDANDTAAVLRSIGFLTHCATDLKLAEMQRRTNRFLQSIEPYATVVFYFSGLGIHYDGNNYLIPTDNLAINGENIRDDALNVEEFIERLTHKAPRAVIVILDCCRPYREPGRTRAFFDRKKLGLTEGLAPVRSPPSTFVVYSGSEAATSTALAIKGRNSIFTYHLVRHIATPNVDIDTLFTYVSAKVQRDTGNRQIPVRYSSVYEDIYLVGGAQPNYGVWPFDRQANRPVAVKEFEPIWRRFHPRPSVPPTFLWHGHRHHSMRTKRRNPFLPNNL